MNEEELAALAEKLIAQGLSDDEVDMHLDRAAMGAAMPENETSPIEAGAMHAFDAITGYSESPRGSGYQGGVGGRQMRTPEETAQQQATAEDRQAALAGAYEEHPVASNVGTYGTLALPIVGMGPEGIANTAKLAGRGIQAGARLAGRAASTAGKVATRAAINYAKVPLKPMLDAIESIKAPKGEILRDALKTAQTVVPNAAAKIPQARTRSPAGQAMLDRMQGRGMDRLQKIKPREIGSPYSGKLPVPVEAPQQPIPGLRPRAQVPRSTPTGNPTSADIAAVGEQHAAEIAADKVARKQGLNTMGRPLADYDIPPAGYGTDPFAPVGPDRLAEAMADVSVSRQTSGAKIGRTPESIPDASRGPKGGARYTNTPAEKAAIVAEKVASVAGKSDEELRAIVLSGMSEDDILRAASAELSKRTRAGTLGGDPIANARAANIKASAERLGREGTAPGRGL